ncbi:hypothetical protein H5410_053621 [Solanum commersonii]|uniref:Uncharacterized protein n=1 Tax=Solanum commersonii TaxID=4109 RepID=A0A9J5X513_SOLCO|nr:hypothetical protein H5410_053621 [Solanum commersonii]
MDKNHVFLLELSSAAIEKKHAVCLECRSGKKVLCGSLGPRLKNKSSQREHRGSGRLAQEYELD